MGVWQLQSLQYICAPFGPFVQGLGRQVFILETGVRFPYGLPNDKTHTPHGVGFFMPKRTSNPRKHWGQLVECWSGVGAFFLALGLWLKDLVSP